MLPVKGVDISEFNWGRKPVDFQALKKQGVEFVIIRCGYGDDYIIQDDPCFAYGVRGAEAAGLPWGVYLMSYATNLTMADSEVRHVLRQLNGRKPAYGVWLDMEANSTLGANLGAIAERFCTSMEKAGLYTGVYASASWFENYLISPVFDRFDRWVAQYYRVCQLDKPYGMWQFTDELGVGGVAFDCNWAYKDYPALTGSKNKEDEIDMTKAELKELIQATVREELRNAETVYNTLEDVPDYWREAVAKAVELSIVKGTGKGGLGLSLTDTKSAVLAVRTLGIALDGAADLVDEAQKAGKLDGSHA